jgi:pilus assembly protein CpaE
VRERLAEGPQPQVIINRYEQKLFSSGLRKADIEQVLGPAFAACIPNHYGLVREAIDRGIPLDEVKPGNKITLQLKKLILPQLNTKRAPPASSKPGKKLAWALARG